MILPHRPRPRRAPRHLAAATAACLALAPAPLAAQQPPRQPGPPAPPAAPAPASEPTLNLRDVDIRTFIADVARVTGASFVIDPRVSGSVSVISDRPLSRAAYFELFLATLRANGFVAVPTGAGQYRVQPAEAGAGSVRGGDRFVTAVIPLANIDSNSAVESLRPVLSRNGTVAANRAGNAIIVTDFADVVARARATLREIDRDRSGTRLVALKHAGPREVAQALEQLLRRSRGADNMGPTATVVAIDAANAIAIRGDAAIVAQMVALATELDRRAAEGAETRVIFLEHADAASILPVLQSLVGQTPTPNPTASTAPLSALAGTPFGAAPRDAGGAPAPVPQVQALPAAGADLGVAAGPRPRQAIIARYDGANALVISARADVQRELGEVVRQLDQVRAQVQVEAIIVEISDSLARQLGVQWLAKPADAATPFLAANFTNAGPDILALAGAVAVERGAIANPTLANALVQNAIRAAAASPVAGGAGVFSWNVGNAVFGTIVSAARNDAASNILATPSVVALDNQPARLLVGQEIPITTGEALGQNLDNSFRTVQRQDVGVQLVVRPQINAGGTIRLEIRQTVSSIASTVAERDFVLNKREVETVVTVADGEILALGGLLSDQERRSLQKVPGLGDIPGLGELFRSRSSSREKTNLMVFLRPTIVRGREQAAAVTANRWNYLREMQEATTGFSSLDALAFDYLRTLPPYRPRPFPGPEYQGQPPFPRPADPPAAPPAPDPALLSPKNGTRPG
ncbi:type II secretion system secretin GspD [Thermaurantiacus tibetensis]|uniref:type II secretion system secretin GspD n=1 Tax=Thermaurantiacus tibetensis TaxID=2759035 RepID=UPI00188E9BA6|nr:type II secretion system secretin GspD [Thermaurantiacus tibetensis]